MAPGRLVLAISVLVASMLGFSAVATAQEAHPVFVAQLSAQEETPPAASLASGFAGFQLSHDGSRIYYNITLTDASTRIVAAHIHLAPRGQAGPIVVPFCTPTTTPCGTEGTVVSGSFGQEDLTGPLQAATLGDLVNEMQMGNIYVNVHSTKYPAGEARGQLVDVMTFLGPPGTESMDEDTSASAPASADHEGMVEETASE